jgi:peptidoglycan/LPS O-acetylase OafA/YrhL
MHGFGLGGLYAYVRDKEDQKKMLLRIINIAFPIALLFHFYWSYSADGGHFNYWFRTMDSIISLWLIHKVISTRSLRVKKYVFENSFLVRIGQISYGIYLIHYPLPWVYEKVVKGIFTQRGSILPVLLNPYYEYIINLVLLFLLARISFVFFERPIMGLKKHFEYKKRPLQPVASYSETSSAVTSEGIPSI